VSEAMNGNEDFYGEERLLTVLESACDACDISETVKRVVADVRSFAGGAKQSDDITVLAARYAPE
jgi:sigma-B regulation protein RsbU (phosphoserine phosphatase)